MESMATIGKGGRIVIPAPFRKKLGLKEGDDVVLSFVDGEVHITTPRHAAEKAQALVRRYVPDGLSLVDELIEDRRREEAGE